jgi:cytochrome P450
MGVAGEPLPPGPRLPSLLQTYLMFRYTDRFGRFCLRRYGPTFALRVVPWGTTVVVTSPEAIKTVFSGDSDVWHGGESYSLLASLIGKRSLILLEDPAHLDARKKLLPHFQGEVVRERYAEVIESVVLEEIARWPTGKPFKLERAMRSITLEVILRAIVGARDTDRIAELREVAANVLELRPTLIFGWLYPTLTRFGHWRRYSERVQRTRELLGEEIQQRQTDLDRWDGDDVLTQLIRADDFEGEDLIDQLMTLLFAGHETTTKALAWVFERLLRHPAALSRARTDDQYLTATIKETLRLRPVIPAVPRRLAVSAEVAGYQLPAGTTVMVGAGLVHLSPDLFDEPERFRPERFLERDGRGYDWVPFGGGTRRCVGASFALFEMRIVVRTVLAHVDLHPDRLRDEPIQGNLLTLAPGRGTRVVKTALG